MQAGAVSLEDSLPGGDVITVIKRRKDHRVEDKLDFHYVSLEAEL